jgi:triosephosphate isomerase (TIM)
MNPSRRPLIAGNWKMNKGGSDGLALAAECTSLVPSVPHTDLLISPPSILIAACSAECEGSGVALAGQNLHPKENGAFTGELSGSMLADAGCTWVLVGHSERRQLFGETDALVASKAHAAFHAGLRPIVCIGETLEEREQGRTLEVVIRQLMACLDVLHNAGASAGAAVAYEPVWAIGTGKTAGPLEINPVHDALRAALHQKSPALSERTRLLYGGSVNAGNASEILRCANVDGALIGGASLEIKSFGAIARAAEEIASAAL